MHVDLSLDLKLSAVDHLFVLLAETPGSAELPPAVRKLVEKTISDSGFGGRSEESITILASEPRKVTLIGLGKSDKLSIRNVRAALKTIAQTAKKQRDANIAVVFPYTLPDSDTTSTTRIVAQFLAAADYKYDAYITVKKEDKRPAIKATLLVSRDL